MAGPIYGVDLASPQGGNVRFDTFLREGIRFAVPKITQGRMTPDPYFDRNYDGARANGVDVPMVYHYLGVEDPIAQAMWTLQRLGSRKKETRVAIDYESPAFTKLTPIAAVRIAEKYGKTIEDAVGDATKRPVVYTGAYFYPWAQGADSTYLATFALWHAGYPAIKRSGRSRAEYEAYIASLPSEDLRIAQPWRARGLFAIVDQFEGDGGLVLPQGTDADFDLFLGDEADYIAFRDHGLLPKRKPRVTMDPSDIQRALVFLGYDPGPVDGVLGPRTRAAIKMFQYDRGLVVDGVVGRATFRALADAVASAMQRKIQTLRAPTSADDTLPEPIAEAHLDPYFVDRVAA